MGFPVQKNQMELSSRKKKMPKITEIRMTTVAFPFIRRFSQRIKALRDIFFITGNARHLVRRF